MNSWILDSAIARLLSVNAIWVDLRPWTPAMLRAGSVPRLKGRTKQFGGLQGRRNRKRMFLNRF